MKYKKMFILIFLFFLILIERVFGEISYEQILKDPNNLELNLQYAKEQEQAKNFKSVIATLERLSTIYSDNLDLKLYLLSISLKLDSKQRTKEILNDIKTNSKLTKDLRERINEIAKVLEEDDKSINNKWAKYIDYGYNYTADNNVNTISNSNSLYISDSLSNYAVDTVIDDNYENIITKYGAFKNLTKTSNVNFNIGKSFTRQNRDKTKESDLHSLFLNYNRSFDKIYSSIFYSFNHVNNLNEADNQIHSLTLQNRLNIKSNQNILLSGNLGLTDYRTDSTFTTADSKNNQNFGGTIGYEYYFAPNHNLKLNIGQNEYEARLDVYGYQNQSKNVSYTNNFKSINYSLTRSLNYNLYDKADTFIKSDTIRDDKIKTDTLSIFGNFDSLLKAEKYSFLKNLFYNLSYSKINSESNIINFDYKKELFKFGLTKRVVFWKK